jgi:nucleoside-diphosphate-sugar epimerase
MDLVTGATGIVGTPLVVKLLSQGQTVRALHRPSSDRALVERAVRESDPEGLSRLEWVEGDVCDQASLETALEGVTRVYHCAALVSFHTADRDALRKVNAEGTANLVNAMLHLGTPRLIHVSSVAALGRKAGQPTDESTFFEEQPGTSAYARSKHRAEMEAYRGAVEGLPEGLVVVNPTVILGAGDFKRSSSALFKVIDRGLSWYPIGSGGYVGAEDVAEVCVRLGESTVRDERFVLCAEHRTHQDVMGNIADALGKPRPKRPVHPWIAGLAWRLVWLYERLTGRRSMVTRESVASGTQHQLYDGTKIKGTLAALGMPWEYTPIDSVIASVAETYRRHSSGS